MSNIGGKANSMVELHNAGIKVPPYLAIGSDLQATFIRENNLLGVIESAISKGDNAYLAAIKSLQVRCVMPEEAKQLWNNIQSEFPQGGCAGIVRSSAACEDGAELSFAGMFESLPFNLNDSKTFFKALISVWLSPFKPHVISYLTLSKQNQLINSLASSMGLLIQPMMNAMSAGVGFATNPLTGEAKLAVKAVRGNGEALNTFGICQSEYQERDSQLELVNIELQKVMLMRTNEAKLSSGHVMVDAGQSWVTTGYYQPHLHKVRVPKKLYTEPCLSQSHRAQLYEQFHNMLKFYGDRNFEFEWLVDDNELFIVQARPITALQDGQSAQTQNGELIPIVHGDFSGEVVEWRAGLTREQVQNKIIVTYQMNYDLIAVLDDVAGIITQIGDSHAHAAIICRELGVSVYKYAQCNKLINGQTLSIKGGSWDVAA
ncbi:MAG: hypothetical protein CMK64_12610 [Pseudoalteromonas sp.]|nr:hypothetical protein [Pseudoalteromonas sp.]|tara:strand:+ start:13619 stop:14911 length:1293 start_codon:yes stop_codon:yes gene_type:complete